jgi:hypothetical protein
MAAPARRGVETHRLRRSIRAITVGTAIGLERKRQRALEDGLGEFVQDFQVPIRGIAGTEMAWTEQEVKFTTTFFDAPEQRDSPYTRPTFTYGVVLESDTPVMVAACVMRWRVDNRDAITGCVVAVGAVNPGGSAPVEFDGHLDATFQGYGYPEVEDTQDITAP